MDEATENKIRKRVSRLVVLTLDEECEINVSHPMENLETGGLYLVLGEVSNIEHYLLYRHWSPTGKLPGMLPGMYELYRFREAIADEL